MLLNEWLETVGREAVAKLAEDIPGGTHGVPKAKLIEWIMSDEAATQHALETKQLNDNLSEALMPSLGFVNRQGDAL